MQPELQGQTRWLPPRQKNKSFTRKEIAQKLWLAFRLHFLMSSDLPGSCAREASLLNKKGVQYEEALGFVRLTCSMRARTSCSEDSDFRRRDSIRPQDTAAGNSWNAFSGGIFMNVYTGLPGSFGICGAMMVGPVLGSKDNGVSIDLGQYCTPFLSSFPITIDTFFGFGYRLPLGKPWAAALAAGFYLGGTFLCPKHHSLPVYDAGGYGPGIGAFFSYSLASNWGIGASVNLGYSLSIRGDEYLMGSTSGLHVFGGAGISIGK